MQCHKECNATSLDSCMWYQNFIDDSVIVISKDPHQQDRFLLGTRELHNFVLNPHYGINAFTGPFSYHHHWIETLITSLDRSPKLCHEYNDVQQHNKNDHDQSKCVTIHEFITTSSYHHNKQSIIITSSYHHNKQSIIITS